MMSPEHKWQPTEHETGRPEYEKVMWNTIGNRNEAI